MFEDAPFVSVQSFVGGFARRVEASCRTDWSALPIMRSVVYKHTAEHTMTTLAPCFGKGGRATGTAAAEYIKAAKGLFD